MEPGYEIVGIWFCQRTGLLQTSPFKLNPLIGCWTVLLRAGRDCLKFWRTSTFIEVLIESGKIAKTNVNGLDVKKLLN